MRHGGTLESLVNAESIRYFGSTIQFLVGLSHTLSNVLELETNPWM